MIRWEELVWEVSPDKIYAEFAKKYVGTYLFLSKEGGKKTPVYVEDTFKTDDGARWLSLLLPNGEGSAKIRFDSGFSDVSLDAWMPDAQYINIPESNDVVWFTRIPARQYKKGLSSENVRCVSLKTKMIYSELKQHRLLDFDILSALLNPVYPQFSEAVAKLLDKNNKTVCVALSPNFALMIHPQTEDKLILLHREFYAADIHENTFVVTNTSLRQEVGDFLRDFNINLRAV